MSYKAIAPIPYTLYYGTFIHTPELAKLEININTLVGVDSSGRIDFIYRNFVATDQTPIDFFLEQQQEGKSASASNFVVNDIRLIDYSNQLCKFFFPGFIDTHIHASQFPNIGIGSDTPLLEWLNTYTFPLESRFCLANGSESKVEFAKDIYSKVIQRTLSNGTTCASYFTTIDPETTNLLADLLLQLGQRGFVGKVCMDHNNPYPDYEESLEDCKKSMSLILSHIDSVAPKGEELINPIITPRFAPTCSNEMLAYLGKLSATNGLPIQTHISENKQELELVAKLFPNVENYAEVYNQHHLLTERTILAHAIHLSQKECDLVSRKKSSISHCPTSNTFISSGEAPIYKYLYKDKINVSLGTDISGGFDSSILQIVKHAILVSHHLSMKKDEEDVECKLSVTDGLYMATMGGARAVGLKNMVGSFEIGKTFDAQLIDLDIGERAGGGSQVDVFEWQIPKIDDSLEVKVKKVKDLLGKWIFSGDDRNCVSVWCNGRLVIDKYTKLQNGKAV
ncbi:hypothetical protein KGF56_002074 [Candida oxycetoniae]|uniref:Probable guanine deaminase n=1 Tax=Candida oxycetoniae TaxID=497107 RepID=A0AAI9WYB7_9ASCO|nr:uncharacterized protein KGF56_002074 [Candida oxycetoniae]KAI3405118.2 hypothetical protein KGF56_002074 [Candida oxycetoniae]